MRRIDALKLALDLIEDWPVVVTCAATSRELASIADRPNHLYLLDSMGLTSSVGAGIAFALDDSPIQRVFVLDGDGSIFMNLGSLATIGYHRPKKLTLAILDNRSYDSTGSFPTYAERLDIGSIAASCGIDVLTADSEDTLRDAIKRSSEAAGPHVLHVQIEQGNAPDIPLLLADPVVIAARFSNWVRSRETEFKTVRG